MERVRPHLLWVAMFVSVFGSGLSGAAASWYVLERTGSTVAVGALWVLITAPGLVVPALGGVLIDRYDRRRLHVVLDVARASVVLAAAWLARRPDLALATVYVLLLLLGIGWSVSWPTLSALVQERTEHKGLVGANSAYQIAVQGGMMSSGAAVGFVYARLGLPGILLVDAATYLLSACGLALLAAGPGHEPAGPRRFLAELGEGLAYLRRRPTVMALGAAWACMLAGILSATVLLVALARDVLRAGARGYGFLESGWAMGAVVGALLASRIVKPRTAAVIPALSLAVLAAGSAALPAVTVLAAAVAAQVVLGASRALGGVAIQSVIMSTVPHGLMGRVQSAFSMASTVLQVVMSVLLGWLAQAVSIPAGFLAVGCLYALAAAAAWRARSLALAGARVEAATMPVA
jgi:MFS family permease